MCKFTAVHVFHGILQREEGVLLLSGCLPVINKDNNGSADRTHEPVLPAAHKFGETPPC
jgi:hypothetical protein